MTTSTKTTSITSLLSLDTIDRLRHAWMVGANYASICKDDAELLDHKKLVKITARTTGQRCHVTFKKSVLKSVVA